MLVTIFGAQRVKWLENKLRTLFCETEKNNKKKKHSQTFSHGNRLFTMANDVFLFQITLTCNQFKQHSYMYFLLCGHPLIFFSEKYSLITG